MDFSEVGLCGSCDYYMPNPKCDKVGNCWRYPPVLDSRNGEVADWTRPLVLASDHCGEFSRAMPEE